MTTMTTLGYKGQKVAFLATNGDKRRQIDDTLTTLFVENISKIMTTLDDSSKKDKQYQTTYLVTTLDDKGYFRRFPGFVQKSPYIYLYIYLYI